MSNSHDVVRSYSYKGRHRRDAQQMRKAAVAVATVGAAAAAPLIGGGIAHADTSGGVWDRVAQCESTNNWSINTNNGFSGGLQFTSSTWAAYGGHAYAPEAYQATKAQQIAVAQRVLASQGKGAWPVCSIKAGLTNDNGGANSGASAAQSESQPAQPAQQAPAQPAQQAPTQPAQQAPAQPSTPEPAQQAPVQPAAPAPENTEVALTGSSYTVQLGDSLSKIALRAHTNWHQLYAANRKVVGANPNMILPGQHLRLTR